MAREIKFRAWVKESEVKIWHMEPVVELHWHEHGFDVRTTKRYWLHPLSGPNAIIMQFTGLQDKNGVDIYEGDIVRFLFTDGHSNEQVTFDYDAKFVGAVVIDSYGATARSKDGGLYAHILSAQYDDAEIEVTGNAHENPELLDDCDTG